MNIRLRRQLLTDTSTRIFTCTSLLFLLALGSCADADPIALQVSPLAAKTANLLKAWEQVGEQQTQAIAQIEVARTESLKLFHTDDAAAGAGWEAVHEQRHAVESAMEKPLSSWHRQLESMVLTSGADTATLYPECVRVLTAWTSMVNPAIVRRALGSSLKGVTKVLGSVDDTVTRRLFLNHLANRYLAVPGVSDVDALCSIVDWSAVFHASKSAGAKQLSGVTEDLILIFTDRGPSGIVLSDAGYYVPGRFTSRGFKLELRDDSDQVRHLSWALRVLANSPFPRQAEQILNLKEVRDSKVRGLPMNQADLALNRVAREWVERVGSAPVVLGSELATTLRRAIEE